MRLEGINSIVYESQLVTVTDYRYCRDRHLEGSKTATLYIDLQINIACRSLFPFQLSITLLYLTFFVYIQSLQSYTLQSSRSCNSSHCRAYSYEPGLPTVLHLIFTQPLLSNLSAILFQKPSKLPLPPLQYLKLLYLLLNERTIDLRRRPY